MRHEHYCAFCGWRRGAATPTMLAPAACPDCGCALASRTLGDEDRPAADAEERRGWRPSGPPPALTRALVLALAVVGAVLLAATGYSVGGAWFAIGAAGLGGFLLAPLLPAG